MNYGSGAAWIGGRQRLMRRPASEMREIAQITGFSGCLDLVTRTAVSSGRWVIFLGKRQRCINRAGQVVELVRLGQIAKKPCLKAIFDVL